MNDPDRTSRASTGPYARWGKRCLDIAISSTALAVLAPVMGVVAGLVRAKLGSPAVFRQARPGRDGTTFTILKFRSMSDARDGDGKLLPDDRRLGAFGKFLRKTSLDELPQLVNVLRGEMSIIGPRPLSHRYLAWYSPREATRHDVRPGITGLAQVSGRNELPWAQRLEYDAQYVERITFVGDLKIFARTVAKVLARKDVREDASTLVSLDDERAAIRRAA